MDTAVLGAAPCSLLPNVEQQPNPAVSTAAAAQEWSDPASVLPTAAEAASTM